MSFKKGKIRNKITKSLCENMIICFFCNWIIFTKSFSRFSPIAAVNSLRDGNFELKSSLATNKLSQLLNCIILSCYLLINNNLFWRFSLPMDLNQLTILTPVGYLARYVSLATSRRQLYDKVVRFLYKAKLSFNLYI